MSNLTVITSIYNEPIEYIRQSIESILNQTYNNLTFVIVLDDPHNTSAKDYIELLAKDDQRIRIIYNDTNIGLTGSLNKALSIVEGDYVARMDADDIAETQRLEKQLDYLIVNSLDLIGASMRRINETGKVVTEFTNRSYSPDCIKKLLMIDNCIPHPTWLGRRKVFETLKGYRDIKACEDYDFLLRALKHNYRIGICDDILLSYRINTSGISRNNSLRQFVTTDYLQKNYGRIDDVTVDEIEGFLQGCISPKEAVNYERGLVKLNSGIEHIKHHNPLGGIEVGMAILDSPIIIKNIIKIIKMGRIKKARFERAKNI